MQDTNSNPNPIKDEVICPMDWDEPEHDGSREHRVLNKYGIQDYHGTIAQCAAYVAHHRVKYGVVKHRCFYHAEYTIEPIV